MSETAAERIAAALERIAAAMELEAKRDGVRSLIRLAAIPDDLDPSPSPRRRARRVAADGTILSA